MSKAPTSPCPWLRRPGVLSFWWKAPSLADHDSLYLRSLRKITWTTCARRFWPLKRSSAGVQVILRRLLNANGSTQAGISGEVNWQPQTLYLGAGTIAWPCERTEPSSIGGATIAK